MLSATGPRGGPLPDCGMVGPSAAPQTARQTAPAAGEQSFADAFAAAVADPGGEPAAGKTAGASGTALPDAGAPVESTRAGDGEQDAASEDLEAAFIVPITELPREALPVTVPVSMTLSVLPEPVAPDTATTGEGGEATPPVQTVGGLGGPTASAAASALPSGTEAPVSAPTPDGQPIARGVFSPAESPVPVDLPDDGHVDTTARPTADPAAVAREIELARTVAPAPVPAREGAPAADTPAAEARPAGTRLPADLMASVQTDAAAVEDSTSGAALADGQGSDGGSSHSPGSDAEAGYAAPSGPPRRFGRVEDMVRELDRQAAESPASSRPVAVDGKAGTPRLAAAPPAAQVPAPAPAPADVPRENVASLVQGIRVQLRQGISEATVRLQPEHFGEVTIAVRIERGMVSAQVHAEASGVCDWLAGQEESIRSNLSEHGLQLDRYVVQRDRPRERRETPQQQNRSRQDRRESEGEQPRFEVAA